MTDDKRGQSWILHDFCNRHLLKPPDPAVIQPVIYILQNTGAAAPGLPDPVRVQALLTVNPVVFLVSPDKSAGKLFPDLIQQV